jgi:hypothetical protein
MNEDVCSSIFVDLNIVGSGSGDFERSLLFAIACAIAHSGICLS